MAAPVVSVRGFTVLRTKLKQSSSDDACHNIYISEHKVRGVEESKPSGRTLFVLSVPPYCTETCLQRLFGVCGDIENVIVQETTSSGRIQTEYNPKQSCFDSHEITQTYRVAYIVFKHKASIKKALQLSFTDIRILYPDKETVIAGMRKQCQEYARCPPNVEALNKECVKFMGRFERKQATVVEEALAKESVPDEEGWTTVSKYGKNKGAPRTEAQESKTRARNSKRNKEKELLHFYAYQIRDAKKEYVAQLREKFEEDKQKIALMKSARKFKPY